MELTGLRYSLSRFELGICLIIIAILFYFAVERISELSVYTEQTGIKILIRNMQSNLDLYKSEKMISGTLDDMAEMVNSNPVGTIFPPPENYRGEFQSPDPLQFSPGDWYYDMGNKHVVYHVIHSDRFISSAPAPARIRLRLEPVFQDLDNNGQFDRGVDKMRGLVLKKVEPYEWR